MNATRVTDIQYINFLIASPKGASATLAADCQPPDPKAPCHDAFTRLLQRLEPDPITLWNEAQPHVTRTGGVLIIDDTVLDKPFARHIDLVQKHWSGKHHGIVQGIDLVSLIWSDGDRIVPCDYRIYHDAQNETKNAHFRDMLDEAEKRGFKPDCVLFDTWYGSLDNMKHVRHKGWRWLTRLKANRLVCVQKGDKHKALSQVEISEQGTQVWLKGYGLVKVFKIVAKDGDIAYWATSDLKMTDLERRMLAEWSWSIETYHKVIKQCSHVEKCQARSAKAQRNHIGMALRTFLRLEWHFFSTGISWFQAKFDIVRQAITDYLAKPTLQLPTA